MSEPLDAVAVLFADRWPVSHEVLGSSFEGHVDSADFTIWLPRALRDESGRVLSGLVPPFENALWAAPEGVDPWGRVVFEAEQSFVARISQIAFTLRPRPHAGSGMILAHAVGPQLNEWLGRAIMWLELWSGNDLTAEDRFEPAAASSIHFRNPADLEVSTWFPAELVYDIATDHPISVLLLESAFEKATGKLLPPDSWALFLAAAKSEDARLAVIEVGTAVEVALSRAVHHHLRNLPEEARNQVIQNCSGVAGLIRILEKIDNEQGKSMVNRTLNQLASLRNHAVHAAKAPSGEQRRAAFETAHALLSKYDPLPSLDTMKSR